MYIEVKNTEKTVIVPDEKEGLLIELLIDVENINWIESEFGKSEAILLLGKTVYNKIKEF